MDELTIYRGRQAADLGQVHFGHDQLWRIPEFVHGYRDDFIFPSRQVCISTFAIISRCCIPTRISARMCYTEAIIT